MSGEPAAAARAGRRRRGDRAQAAGPPAGRDARRERGGRVRGRARGAGARRARAASTSCCSTSRCPSCRASRRCSSSRPTGRSSSSAPRTPRTRSRAFDLGAVDYLLKPVEAGAAAQGAGSRARARRAPPLRRRAGAAASGRARPRPLDRLALPDPPGHRAARSAAVSPRRAGRRAGHRPHPDARYLSRAVAAGAGGRLPPHALRARPPPRAGQPGARRPPGARTRSAAPPRRTRGGHPSRSRASGPRSARASGCRSARGQDRNVATVFDTPRIVRSRRLGWISAAARLDMKLTSRHSGARSYRARSSLAAVATSAGVYWWQPDRVLSRRRQCDLPLAGS